MTTKTKEIIGEVKIHDTPYQLVGYANISGVSITPEEAIIHFATRQMENPNEADGVAKIYLSIPHAKRIMLVLAQIIQDHEIYFGEIEIDANARLTEQGRGFLEEKAKAIKENRGKKE